MVSAFEGNKAETTTIVPAIQAFQAAHRLTDVTVVADAGMVSASNQQAIEDAGLSFIFGARISDVPYVVAHRRREHPGQDIPDGHVFTQPWPAGPAGGRRDQVIYYQYRADRARRALRGIDEQVAKAEKAVAGKIPVKRNRFIQPSRGHPHAALAVSHWIETTTGWSIKKFVRTARRYRTITIQAGPHTITAADPVPADLQAALTKINNVGLGAH